MLNNPVILGVLLAVVCYIAYDLVAAIISNNQTDTLIARANTAYDNNRFRECAKCLERVVRREPGNTLQNFRLAWAYHLLGQLEPAFRYMLKAAELDAKYIDARSVLAEWYYEQNDHWRALLYARQAIELDKYQYDARLTLGKCCVALGDTATATEEVAFFERYGQESYACELTECIREGK
ncbi:hypothetical protein RDn1_024 [Candidatus Termititenax dinenymphae]|uniref:Uncharacterized protein n=1 Tax=Candidatus Termititenax dinenymphae TaxID=2218523 RepID=A0A388TLT6_9BACT|nr:hypothetical protein RDn1_024 [Candidatus Termititenax dinenymphae]